MGERAGGAESKAERGVVRVSVCIPEKQARSLCEFVARLRRDFERGCGGAQGGRITAELFAPQIEPLVVRPCARPSEGQLALLDELEDLRRELTPLRWRDPDPTPDPGL